MSLKTYYPLRKIYKNYRIQVSDLHELYVEECGNPNGVPVVWCHGGPGSGLFPDHGRMFDPDYYRLILFDQRGSGKSTPFAEIKENTSQHLISDLEVIREKLNIDKWLVAGRSWGTTLSLLYAQAYPERVLGLALFAVFLCDDRACNWLFQDGAGRVYTEAWADFLALVPATQQNDIMTAYKDLMFGDDQELAVEASRRWSTWEAKTLTLKQDASNVDLFTSDQVMLAISRLECHYLSQRGFLRENQIISDANRIAHLPVQIVHGRYDMNCLHDNAWRLSRALPKAILHTVPQGAHAASDPETIDAQVRAADSFKLA